ncbi:aldehyde dehydrogenase [Granulosicoccus antarcticus]|uniref:Aldehyde dehydrogenase PuuC n=1 Tax=Granulosicoccus antarcticus IMCC3135 TaxID=1192854 RepID=A0A2Z2NSP9_9GAMM|nr:aldehyde dehydrogenase [Granulosicoccus antarcticus]ASJ70617.1 Aldehyde dehydrogenase PuuC [Granulosicoccus antarcticus IMCC3135]
MSELLTQDEYKCIANALNFPQNAFIDGGFRPALSGEVFKSINPATGESLTDVAACNSDDVDVAVAKAREAFEDGRWSRRSPSERKSVLIKLCKLLTRESHELAVMESVDSGKTVFDCETVDIPETIHCLQWHAELIDKIYDQVSPASDDHIALVVREPIGVVGLVLPWNFPLLMLAWKIGPALAAGCSVVVKPAAETSLTALRVAELAFEAGVPAGVFNVVTGSGEQVGEPLGRHPDVDMVSFTGSTITGRRFLGYAGESNLKEVVLEMGGKNPCIVMNDAENLDVVANHIVNGAFWNMGENCSAASRLIVHKDIKEALLERILAHAREWNIGDPLDPSVRVGALVSPAHFKKVCSYLDLAEPSAIRLGGKAIEGAFVEPTIIEVKDNQDKLAREEIFGPILTVITISSFDEAIRVANDTEYGLAASLFTSHIKRGIRGARELKAGTVTINSFGEGDISTPFGGYKSSGFGGRDNSIHAHDQYTQLKTIWIDLSDDDNEAVD